ncbi:MAG TPA: DNA-3-methyladenine glycosylase I, partial [Thermomicrobiaceae bacterium]|nr:DNA-3-methyladenine glycosylase I [Thermomicrobiaceae bacterium]
LRKREGFRRAFHGFAVERVAALGEADVARLLEDTAIVRHRGKIAATIANARAVQAIQAEHGSLRDYLRSLPDDPALAHPILRRRLAFFGPTTCRSFFQASGIIAPEHEPTCWLARTAPPPPLPHSGK